MKSEELPNYLKQVSDLEIQENITAGPSNGMSIRYSASVLERERRLKKQHWTSKLNLFLTAVAALAAVLSAYFAWRSVPATSKFSQPASSVSSQSQSSHSQPKP